MTLTKNVVISGMCRLKGDVNVVTSNEAYSDYGRQVFGIVQNQNQEISEDQ